MAAAASRQAVSVDRDPLVELALVGERLDNVGPLAWAAAAIAAGTVFVFLAAVATGPLGLVAAVAPVVLVAVIALIAVHGLGRLVRPWLLQLPGTRPGLLMQDVPARSSPLPARGHQRRLLATTHGPDGIVVLALLVALFVVVGAIAAYRVAATSTEPAPSMYDVIAEELVRAARDATTVVVTESSG